MNVLFVVGACLAKYQRLHCTFDFVKTLDEFGVFGAWLSKEKREIPRSLLYFGLLLNRYRCMFDVLCMFDEIISVETRD